MIDYTLYNYTHMPMNLYLTRFRYNWHHHWICCCGDSNCVCRIDLLYSLLCWAPQTKAVESKTTYNDVNYAVIMHLDHVCSIQSHRNTKTLCRYDLDALPNNAIRPSLSTPFNNTRQSTLSSTTNKMNRTELPPELVPRFPTANACTYTLHDDEC